jgi:hypothetical protein
VCFMTQLQGMSYSDVLRKFGGALATHRGTVRERCGAESYMMYWVRYIYMGSPLKTLEEGAALGAAAQRNPRKP